MKHCPQIPHLPHAPLSPAYIVPSQVVRVPPSPMKFQPKPPLQKHDWHTDTVGHADFVVRPMKEYASEEVFSASQWTGYLSTASDHRRLPPEVLAKLLDAVSEALGAEVTVRARTIALYARRGV